MLFLKPPFQIIKGVAVFPDHEMEDVFHFAPAMPHLTTRPDPASGAPIPQFSLLKYRGDDLSGGFLTFSVDLSIDEATMLEVETELQARFGLLRPPRMSAIGFEDGDVQLMILGHQSTSDEDVAGLPSDANDTSPRFVRNAHNSKPSLYGANTAIFSVELDADGVQLMEAALAGETSGIGIIYTLHFNALRPAYNVRITADWDRVQTHFEEGFSGRVVIASFDVAKVVDELIDDRVITVEVDTFLSESEDGGSWVGNRNQAIDELKDMVTQTFFEPVVPEKRAAATLPEQLREGASEVGLLVATGGWSGLVSLKKRHIDTTQIDRKTLNVSMSERVTMRKTIYPQAVLEGLLHFPDETGQPMDMTRFVQDVTLGDPWFQRHEVTAHALIDFEAAGIAAINVEMSYHGVPKSLRLTKDTPSLSDDWPSVVVDGKMDQTVDYSYSVDFVGVDAAERPARVQSAPMQTSGTAIDISPQGDRLYFQGDVVIGTSAFPWDRFPTVEVHLRYTDAPNGIAMDDSVLLTQAKPEHIWRPFRLDPAKTGFEIKRIFHGVDGRDREIDWQLVDEDLVILTDPMPQRRTVQVQTALDWTVVNMVLVEVTYEDVENNLIQSAPMTFLDTPDGKLPQTFSVNLVDASKRFIRYRATIINKDGTQVRIPTSETQELFVTISAGMLGHRVIEVHGPDADLAANGLTRIEVELSFADADAGLSSANKLIFDAPGQVKFFEYDYASEDRMAVSVLRTDVHQNGLAARRDLGQTTDNRVVLTLG